MIPPRYTAKFDEACDVLVVGFGLAGAAAAIEACDAGADVLIVEKMAMAGGISATAGGGFVVTSDPDNALIYLRATNRGNIPDPILRHLARGMAELHAYFVELARVNGAKLRKFKGYGTYPFPGLDAFEYLIVDRIPGFDPERDWPHVQGDKGPFSFKLFQDNVSKLPIKVSLSTPAVRLITDLSGEVHGAWVWDSNWNLQAIMARQGVILACGGFEANTEMQREYWQLGTAMSASFLGNTGDGIQMAVDVGADLWHMWHFHGSLGFRHPDKNYPLGIRMKQLPNWTPQYNEKVAKMAWIIVDVNGRRFMNEYPPYPQDTGYRGVEWVDLPTASFPRIPCYMLVDDKGRRLYRLGEPRLNDTSITPVIWEGQGQYDWDEANLNQVEQGILKQFNSVDEMARYIGCEPAILEQTLNRWNDACARACDDEFQRPPKSMVPIKTPPFIVGELWPLVSNTQGGPKHDERQRVLNSFGEPIPRLFEAGEVGGAWGFLYLGGGNYSECVVSGRIAAREAVAITSWNDN